MPIIATVLAFAAMQGQQIDPGKLVMPKGLLEGAQLRAQFNADKEFVRLLFIFAPS